MQARTKIKGSAATGRTAVKAANTKRKGLWSTLSGAVTDALKGLTGRKQAERRRKRIAAAGAAGAATAAAGAAGVVLSKKKSKDAEAAREAAYQAPQPTPETAANGAAATVPSGSEPSA
jgi:hypothetical protein